MAAEGHSHAVVVMARGPQACSPPIGGSCCMAMDASPPIDPVYRTDWGRIVAALIRLVRDFDVAEEAAQEAFAAAVDQWPISGVPEFPRAWIIQTARHKALDRIRRQTRFQ